MLENIFFDVVFSIVLVVSIVYLLVFNNNYAKKMSEAYYKKLKINISEEFCSMAGYGIAIMCAAMLVDIIIDNLKRIGWL